MQSENFDDKIKDSLSQRPPGNDTPEWDKMQALLDRHLPVEKKDRRRLFFILFLFLLLGGGALIIWKNNSSRDDNISDAEPNKENAAPINKPGATDKSTESSSTQTGPTSKNIPQNKSAETPQKIESTGQRGPGITQKSDRTVLPRSEKAIAVATPKTNVKRTVSEKDARKTDPNKQLTEKTDNTTQPITSVEKEAVQKDVPAAAEKQKAEESQKVPEPKKPEDLKTPEPDKVATDQKESKPVASQPILTANSKSQKQKNKNSFFNNLFFTVSAGPDLSAVGINDVGKLRPVIGAGIGYQVSKKFSVRTGFYSARKVYTADPYDYHPPYNVWAYYPNLKNIEANCKVYEIPVTVDYTISQTKKQSWFVSAGLSSFLMKEETYDYYYKPNTSPTYITYTKKINDQNKHYFSVLDLSGGYTRHINKNLSLRAEPYVKFALGGVGYGKVKLNSGGVLFSAVIKPFARK